MICHLSHDNEYENVVWMASLVNQRHFRGGAHHPRDSFASLSLSQFSHAFSLRSAPVSRIRLRPRAGKRSGVHHLHSISNASTTRTAIRKRTKTPNVTNPRAKRSRIMKTSSRDTFQADVDIFSRNRDRVGGMPALDSSAAALLLTIVPYR